MTSEPSRNENVNGNEEEEDDDVPTLSASTLAALQEFLASQVQDIKIEEEDTGNEDKLFEKDLSTSFPEDWQMSQFWYDEETSEFLANEVLRVAGNEGKIVCVSCPSVFRACKGASNVTLFEYDRRFEAFGDLYKFYDYNEPEKIPDCCRGAYSIVIADPPFLSVECLTKLAVTVKLLMKPNAKIILCTGEVMTEHAENLLGLRKTAFIPRHKNNLGNEFCCFSNYEIPVDHKL